VERVGREKKKNGDDAGRRLDFGKGKALLLPAFSP
jgi:hypothetical protein